MSKGVRVLGKARGGRAHVAEELERRVLLSSAVAAFAPQVTIGTGGATFGVVAGDVNRDGKPDLIYSNPTQARIGVLLGNGDGTFKTALTFAAGSGARGLALSDVNGDGRLDVVVPNANDNDIGVLLGNGDGTFGAQWTIATGPIPFWVSVADVNGDAKPDLLSAGKRVENSLSVMLGNGDGTFAPRGTVALGSSPNMVATGDFNRDGKLDVAVDNDSSNSVGVLLGNGHGSFGAQTTVAAYGVSSVAVGDMNGDGKQDLLMGVGNNLVGVALGNGDGTFKSAATFLAAGGEFYSVAVADVNGDGKPDAVVTDWGAAAVGVMLGNGDGTLGAQQQIPVGAWPQGLAVADLNGDGRIDVVTANYVANSLSVVLGDAPPRVVSINRMNPVGPITSNSSVVFLVTFSEPVTGVDPTDFASAGTGVSVSAPLAVSGSGSGSLYTVTASGITGTGTLGLNLVDDRSIVDSGGNHLAPGRMMSFGVKQVGATGLAVPADVNRDGVPDLVLGGPGVAVAMGNGDGTFKPAVSYSPEVGVNSVSVQDLNGDGVLDVVVLEDGSIGILLGNGDGTLRPQLLVSSPGSSPSVAISDVNLDGRPDLIFAPHRGGPMSVLLGNGDGSFQPAQTLGATGVSAFTVSDVNGDGRPDIVVSAVGFKYTIGVMSGNGNGTFQAQRTFAPYNADAYAIRVADMNGDGRADLVLAYSSLERLGVVLGNGDGTFLRAQTVATDVLPVSVEVGDVNGDGRLDVVAANRFADDASILLGNGDGSLQSQQTFSGGGYTPSVGLCDLNRDGLPDIVVGADGSSPVELLGTGNGSLIGQAYTVVPLLDTINGTSGTDQVTLDQDPDHVHIDWTLGSFTAQVAINDPKGLTINGLGSADLISLFSRDGNALPHRIQLNGQFSIRGFQTTPSLAGTTIDINRSTVFVDGSGNPNVQWLVKQCLSSGYGGGTWGGTWSGGVITSSAAASGPAGMYGIGWADSADGTGVNTVPNTIELKFTVMGDVNLDGAVNSTDSIVMARNYLAAGKSNWDQGNFNYDGVIDFGDAQILQKNYGLVVGSSVVGSTANAVNGGESVPVTGSTGGSGGSSDVMSGGGVEVGVGKGRRRLHGRNGKGR